MREDKPMSAVDREAYADALQRMLVFESLDRDFVREVAWRCRLVHADRGETLMEEGERGDEVYFLLNGLVGINIESIAPYFEVGITRLGPGATIGEMALIDREERSATVVAVEPCTLLMTTIPEIEAVTRLHPIQGMLLYRNIAAVLARRLRTMNRKLTAMMRSRVRRAPG